MVQELFEPAEYIDQRGPGYFSICGRPNDRWRQDSYELEHLPTVVEAVNPNLDTWITQAVFSKPNRRAMNMESVGLLFADLDTYNAPGLREKGPEEQARLLVGFCAEEGLPAPSLVLFSGRGLQPKWLLTEAIGPIALHDWNQAELALVRLLEPFAADGAARDISRVLRLDRTTNTKSGEKCRIVYTLSGVENVLARYDFTELFENLTDRFRSPEPKPTDTRLHVVRTGNKMSFQRLNWFRLYDIRDLWNLRGGVPAGFRETTLFWELNFLLRAEPVRSNEIWKEAETLAANIDTAPGWYHNSDLSTVYRKAKELMNGAGIEYNGRKYPPLYTPRNQTLINIFQITADEEQKLRTIISSDERVRRQRERRRAAGVKPRAEYESRSNEQLRPWERLNISRAWWYKLKSQGKI